jgi:hypothetical protein
MDDLVVSAPNEGGITIASDSTSAGAYLAFADGTSGDTAYRGFVHYAHGSDYLRFGTAATERMRIDSSGYVTIGSAGLSADAGLKFQADTGTFTLNHERGSHSLVLSDSDGTGEVLRVDTSGNLLVGTTTVGIASTTSQGLNVLGQYGAFEASRNNASLFLNRLTSDGDIAVFRKDGTTVGSIGTSSPALFIGSGDVGIRFDGANDRIRPVGNASNLEAVRNGAIDLGDSGARFKDLYLSGGVYAGAYASFVQGAGGDLFITNTYSSGDLAIESGRRILFKDSGNEAGRFDGNGNLLVGKTSSSLGTDGVELRDGTSYFTNTSQSPMAINREGTDGQLIGFYNDEVGAGAITCSGSTVTYSTSSDQRLKENIADADDAGSKIDAIQVRKYDWKADGSHQDYGMIAQELQAVAPEAVSGDADSEEMMGVDYSKLVPMLVKEIQSLRNRVAQLEE